MTQTTPSDRRQQALRPLRRRVDPDDLSIDQPHARPADEVVGALGVDPTRGLLGREVDRRRRLIGRNALAARPAVPWIRILRDQVRSAVVLLLVAAVVAGLVIGETVEALAVLTVLVVNTIVGFTTELRATRAMEALASLASAIADVQRDGRRNEVDASELVPGDIVRLEAGDRVPADLRLVEATDLEIDEAPLTGESLPVDKSPEPVAPGTGLADRSSMAFLGTTVGAGRATGVVVATGPRTEVGRVAELADTADVHQAPLQQGLERLGRVLSLVVIGLALALAGLGLLRGLEIHEILEVSIALAVAIVPEGLPAVATLTLTVGMRRMAKRNALVRRLPVVETLGSTTVIASDKTGTLTANRMTVVDVATADGVDIHHLWVAAVLCNDADLAADGSPIGDPTEVALLRAAAAAGVDWRAIRTTHPRRDEVPFDSATKRMATVHDGRVYVKGAPEVILHPADEQLRGVSDRMAGRALRTLALARRSTPRDWDPATADDAENEELFTGLEPLGVVGIEDPPRPEAIRAVRTFQGAGIRVVMITGDQPRTATAIARQLGMRTERVVTGSELAEEPTAVAAHAADVDVFARVAPEQKLDIVRALQGAGEVVAVTGDGVNDAPALRQADVGVAMGRTGTDVAREAADVVLTDDDISTLEHAVEEGRRIFANIRRFAQFLFSYHLSVVIVITAAIALGLDPPIAGLMVLWNNLVIDVIPSFALALEPGSADAMREPPRPRDEPVLGRATVRRIVAQGALVGSVGLAAFLIGREVLDLPLAQQQTLTFVTVTAAQLGGVFTARSETGSGFAGSSRNPYLWGGLALTIALEAVALGIPAMRDLLDLTVLPGDAWLTAAALAPLPLVVTVLGRRLRRI